MCFCDTYGSVSCFESLVLLFWNNPHHVFFTLYINIRENIRIKPNQHTTQKEKKKLRKTGTQNCWQRFTNVNLCLWVFVQPRLCLGDSNAKHFLPLYCTANEMFHEEWLRFWVSCLAICFICCSSSTVSLHAWISKLETSEAFMIYFFFSFTFRKWASNRFFLPAILFGVCVCNRQQINAWNISFDFLVC